MLDEERQKIISYFEGLKEKLATATPKERILITAEAAFTMVLIKTTPEDWEAAEKTLVEVRIPEECSTVFKDFQEAIGTSVADIESAFINYVVQLGIIDLAKYTLKKVGIKEAK